MKKLMLVDGNSILNRAFYGLQGKYLLATSDGLFTNAIYGFLNILNKYMEEVEPEFICVAFDVKKPTFRHKEYKDYKGKRKKMPDELAVQVPVIKELLDAMNIKRLEFEGFEADDIIGSLSKKADEEGYNVTIVSGDKDVLQLVSQNITIKMPKTKMGKTQTETYDLNKILETYGIQPSQFIDLKGLMGDPSDNIPGVPGVGEKTGLDLIKKYNTIEGIYENIDSITRKALKEKLLQNKDIAFLSRKLATIEKNMLQICEIDELKKTELNKEKLYELFKKLEFKNFIEKYNLEDTSKSKNVEINYEIQNIKNIDELKDIKKEIILSGELSLYCLADAQNNHFYDFIGIGLTYNENKSYFIDFDIINEESFLSELTEIFADEKIKKFGHDLKWLITYLKFKNINIEGINFDTMIASYIIDPSKQTYSLSDISSEFLDIEVESIENLQGKGKNFKTFRQLKEENVLEIAAKYSTLILKLKYIMASIIEKNSQNELYYQIELPLVEVLANMEYWGFKVNTDTLEGISNKLETRISELIDEIYLLAGKEFNINSPKQLGIILFEDLGLPIIKKTKTGYSTDIEVLEQLQTKHDIVDKIVEYRHLVKLKSTYVDGLKNVLNPNTEKIHSSFNQTVTVTGRISSTEPNLQNIPIKLDLGREIRKVFVPSSEEFVLLDADYSQIELRVLAHITKDENMIEAFVNNEDIHTTTAANIAEISPIEVTPLLRSRAKAVNFSIVYGIGDFSLAKDLNITRKEAKAYIDGYLNKYPGVKEYMHDIVEKAKADGFVTTMFNRRRYLPEITSSNFNIRSFGERVALNTPIQGSAADIIKIAMVKVYNDLKKKKLLSRIILQVHDELIIETHKTEIPEVKNILKDSMEKAVKLAIPLCAEVKVGDSWYETK